MLRRVTFCSKFSHTLHVLDHLTSLRTQEYFCKRSLLPTCKYHTRPDSLRSFVSSASLQKRGGKITRSETPIQSHTSKDSDSPDPFDFSGLQAGIDKAQAQLKDELSKLRAGGRFNPETLENIRVNVVKGSKDTERIADLTQVVPRGRVLNVIVGDKEHVKPVSSAIQAAKLNLVPQPDAHNPNQLNINLPPPTSESRQAVVQSASKLAETASTTVKNARATQQKRFRTMQLSGVVRPDDLKQATTKMEKLVQDGSAAVKKAFESAKKVLEST